MYCGKCGKKIHDDMLYCPFCGNAVVVPDQDDEEEDRGESEAKKTEPVREMKRKPRKTISLFDEKEYEQDAREKVPDDVADVEKPLVETKRVETVKEPEPEADSAEDTEDAADEAAPDNADAADIDDAYDAYDEDDAQDADVYDAEDDDVYDAEDDSPADKRSRFESVPTMRRRGNGTFIPVRNTRSEDMFLGTEEKDRDEYDDYDEDDYDYDDSYDYEPKKPKKSFFKRHAAGLIAICAVLILVIGAGIFACMDAGQQLLARVNLAWKPNAYAAVGYSEYQNGKYAESANYYVKAFEKDNENYEYAHSAMVAYYDAEDIDNAAKMAIACIDLKPDDAEPYRELLSIYANAEMPSMVRNYIQQGYRNTGDSYLDPNNWVDQQ